MHVFFLLQGTFASIYRDKDLTYNTEHSKGTFSRALKVVPRQNGPSMITMYRQFGSELTE